MATLPKLKEIDSLKDLREAITMLTDLGLSLGGLTSLENAKERLRFYINNPNKSSDKSMDLDIVKEDVAKRNILLKKYQETRAYLEKLPSNIKSDLHELFPNFQDTLERHIFDLRQRECLIMLAGETGSGKSSLINMILKHKVLPVSPLCCTACFCEIRRSQNNSKYAKVHFKDSSKSPLQIDLNTNEGLKQLADYVQLPNDPDVDCESSIVKIFWPSNVLKEGVVLVDTPGIGENTEMISYLASYMSKAFGFIYVINAASAGGVQKDRLSRLLRVINEGSSEVEYLTEATIFVSNKWESIPVSEKQEVREDTLHKLRKFYPNLQDEQLICLSISNLIKLQDEQPPAELQLFYTAMKTLIPATMKNKILRSYKWLSSLLKRSVYSLKVKTHAGNRNLVNKSELYSTLRRQISTLEKKSIAFINEMRSQIQQELAIIKSEFISYLKSEAVKTELTKWSSSTTLSSTASHWRELGQQTIDLVGAKIMSLINDWEIEQNIVNSLNTRMVEKFKDRFDDLEMQIYNVESTLAGDKEARKLQQSLKKPFKPKGITNIFQRGGEHNSQAYTAIIGFNISSLGHVSLEKKDIKKKLKSILGSSKPKTKELLQDVSKYYVISIVEHEKLQNTLAKFFNKVFRDIDMLGSRLPEFLKADQALLDNIEREFMKNEQNFSERLPDFITECNRLQGSLDMFYVKELFVPDIDLKQIEMMPGEPPLGTGSFATVYFCQLRINNTAKKAAVKAWSERLSTANVSDTLLEDSILREIKHKNIIHYYGSNYRKLQDGSLQWLMILEYCHTTLKSIFVRDDDKYQVNPGKYSIPEKQKKVMKHLCHYVQQLCEAIAYLHHKNLVHRDLKMENILVTEENIIKLIDVGLSKLERDIAGSIAGSPCFMAPEIFERKFIYGKKADIYSLSIILWEMWYGMDVVTYIKPLIQKGIEESVKSGLRPSFQLAEKPPDDYKTLVQKCWNADPKMRPSIEECAAFFKKWP
ncbi:uncharacterized protein LOC106883634 [Octopus bimaculoides]|uniref:Protein kinase domain-containing protein n=1 Tax=Octopus bimaculoides TaxID=37653 RepID=A0A0L8FGI5_OCTBM|nr:uncharacterized protein LOC106883634 [Octopus bimaculoides]|eukprot:XP_014790215.1 PREDICTED: uncharacterized protein LOC106883634 [Octopus bimaculoides]